MSGATGNVLIVLEMNDFIVLSIHEDSLLTSQELRQSPTKRRRPGRNKQPQIGSSQVSLKQFTAGINMVLQKIQDGEQALHLHFKIHNTL